MPLSVNQSIRKAQRLAKAGEIENAAAVFHSILKQFPENARAAKGLDDLKKGVRSAADALHAPSGEQLHKLTALTAQGQCDAARRQAAELLKQFPLSFELYNILGVNQAKTGRHLEAVASYTQALAIRPDCVEALWNLGAVLKRLGDREQSIACYEKALALKPDDAETHINLGDALAYFNRADAAATAYEKAAQTATAECRFAAQPRPDAKKTRKKRRSDCVFQTSRR